MRRRTLLALPLMLLATPAAAAGKPDKAPAETGSYVQLPTLTATIIRPNGRRGVLTLEAGLDAPDPALREHVELVLPRLRAAYVQALQTYARGLAPGHAPNADLISRQLQRETDRTLGRAGARLLLGAMLVN